MGDVIDTENNLYIILELADGGELFDKILEKIRFSEKEAKLHFYQMVSAVAYLHKKNIAHRDLKPENVLLSNDDSNPLIKISDMGLSKLVDHTTFLQTFCGTPQYLAPEVLISRVRGDGSYGFEVDMWSLGVILYILLCGCPPFSTERALAHPWLNEAENVEMATKLMEAEKKKQSRNSNGHLSLPRPESLIYESESAINRKKRLNDTSSNDMKLSSETKAFSNYETNGCDSSMVPPSKKMKV